MYYRRSYYWNDAPDANYKDDFPPDSKLFVVCCGFSKIKTLPYFDTVHSSRKDYQLIYVANGKMHFTDRDGNEKIAAKGNILLFKPNERQQYKIYLKDNSEFYWIHFAGTEVDAMLNHFGMLNNRCFDFRPNAEIPIIYNKIIAALGQRAPFFDDLCSVYLQELILTAVKFNTKQDSPEGMPPVLEKITRYINEHYSEELYIEKLAADNNLSARMLQRYFKKHYFLTPNQYITEIRISNAKDMLFSSNSIEKIAQAVGFSDPLYFSTVFHRETGMTPSEYKKNLRKSVDL